MIVIAMAQILMSFNVNSLPVSIGGIVASFNAPSTLVGTAIVTYSLFIAGFVCGDATGHQPIVHPLQIQPYLNAALLALSFGGDALSTTNPYRGSKIDFGDLTFGGKNVVALLGQAALIAEKAAWYENWLVHRRLRPEVFGLGVHHKLSGTKPYDILPDLLHCDGVSRVQAVNGTCLIPITYPEGSPTHPSYPAAHATIAGACATVLKAFFNEDSSSLVRCKLRATGCHWRPGRDLA
jgi:membrane-associated phospholipid phosphatase